MKDAEVAQTTLVEVLPKLRQIISSLASTNTDAVSVAYWEWLNALLACVEGILNEGGKP